MVKLLCSASADAHMPEDDGSTPLLLASFYCRMEVVRLCFVSVGPRHAHHVNQDELGPILAASLKSHTGVARDLYNARGCTAGGGEPLDPLHAASYNRHAELVRECPAMAPGTRPPEADAAGLCAARCHHLLCCHHSGHSGLRGGPAMASGTRTPGQDEDGFILPVVIAFSALGARGLDG